MGELTITALVALAHAVPIMIWGSILRRIGYGYWWALLLLVPIVNIVSVLVVVGKEWPIEREAARLRMIAGESTDWEADAESVMSAALVHEEQGQTDQAISLYNLVAVKTANERVRRYAETCVERLLGKQERSGLTSQRS